MAHSDDSDDARDPAIHSFLDHRMAELVLAQSSSASRQQNSQALAPNASSSTRSSPALYGTGRPTLALPRRTSSALATPSQSNIDLDFSQRAGSPSSSQTPTVFANPNRSLFASGPPTASVSANTAHASMSSPPNMVSSHPLSALTGSSISASRRQAMPHQETASGSRRARFSGVEKDVDDPLSGVEDVSHSRRRDTSTPTAVSRLFAAPEPPTPGISRHGSYIRTHSGTQYIKAMPIETAPLPSHLYTEGLLSGRHSDITIVAFGSKYPLHRLLLDRAPFFRSAFSEPWYESSAKEITLHPEEIDTNITKTAFELALKRLYGCNRAEEEDSEATGLFATGCWLDMTDLIESSISSLLRQMTTSNLANSIQLATSNYYGKHGNRILAAAKAMLCREAWEMPLRYFDGISGETIREIVGCDGFYVPKEWDRYILAKRIFNRRLKAAAIEAGLIDARARALVPLPESIKFMTIRFDAVYRKTFSANQANSSDASDRWLAIYTTPDIAPLLVLLDEGVHYVHFSFEQLQRIRESKDVLGLPLIPEKVISSALWMSMELRQHVLNAQENELELGLSYEVEDTEEPGNDISSAEELNAERVISLVSVGKRKEAEAEEGDMDSGSWDGNGKPRKFWIPVADATYPLGGDLEPVLPSPNGSSGYRTRNSASMEPQDLQWATDFASAAQERPDSSGAVSNTPGPQISFTHYPPFRFAVEFPAARTLKENKRVYSSTVWYAGSLWNVYVQKKETSKGTQLGIYLHRERQVDGSTDLLTTLLHNSVNERISDLERETVLGRSSHPRNNHSSDYVYANDDSSSGGDTTLVGGASHDIDTLSGMLPSQTGQGITKASEASLSPNGRRGTYGSETPKTEDDREEAKTHVVRHRGIPTLPPYADSRPTIKTYFKIYTPSKGGRVLSVYESAPDKFNFSQSWGWKSSNLVLDDSIGALEDERTKEPRLRFMVVIGTMLKCSPDKASGVLTDCRKYLKKFQRGQTEPQHQFTKFFRPHDVAFLHPL